jgi:hypothetical protein
MLVTEGYHPEFVFDDYEYREGDFELSITANRTQVSAGKRIRVTATFKNLSGRSFPVFRRSGGGGSLNERFDGMISVKMFEKGEEFSWRDANHLSHKLIRKGDVYVFTTDFVINTPGNYEICAFAFFYVGHERIESNFIGIRSNTLRIRIT